MSVKAAHGTNPGLVQNTKQKVVFMTSQVTKLATWDLKRNCKKVKELINGITIP